MTSTAARTAPRVIAERGRHEGLTTMSVMSDEQTAAPSGGKPRSALDLPALRAQLAAQPGKHYWRSLDELANSEEFQSFVHREFPEQAPDVLDPVGRRTFIKLM